MPEGEDLALGRVTLARRQRRLYRPEERDQRALDLLKSAKRPLIILGKGAAYARADDAAGRALIEVIGPGRPPADHLSLVDPHGNLVLAYGPVDRARALLEDTKRLLKYSHIG